MHGCTWHVQQEDRRQTDDALKGVRSIDRTYGPHSHHEYILEEYQACELDRLARFAVQLRGLELAQVPTVRLHQEWLDGGSINHRQTRVRPDCSQAASSRDATAYTGHLTMVMATAAVVGVAAAVPAAYGSEPDSSRTAWCSIRRRADAVATSSRSDKSAGVLASRSAQQETRSVPVKRVSTLGTDDRPVSVPNAMPWNSRT